MDCEKKDMMRTMDDYDKNYIEYKDDCVCVIWFNECFTNIYWAAHDFV